MCPFISSITTSDMPIHIPSKYHHFILRDTTYQMKYLIPKTKKPIPGAHKSVAKEILSHF